MTLAYKLLIELLLLLAVAVIGFLAGMHHTQLRWDLAEAQHRIDVAQVIATESMKVYEAENRHRKEMDQLAVMHMRNLDDVKAQHAAALAALRTGGLRLTVPATGCLGSAASGFAATAAGGDAAPRTGLSEEAGEFLVNLAADADEVVVQLQACQAVVLEDRAVR
ncbi:MAG: lysis system i-spanin subunit Rz [Leptothrix sp. (in: b-proteobacteria)]